MKLAFRFLNWSKNQIYQSKIKPKSDSKEKPIIKSVYHHRTNMVFCLVKTKINILCKRLHFFLFFIHKTKNCCPFFFILFLFDYSSCLLYYWFDLIWVFEVHTFQYFNMIFTLNILVRCSETERIKAIKKKTENLNSKRYNIFDLFVRFVHSYRFFRLWLNALLSFGRLVHI